MPRKGPYFVRQIPTHREFETDLFNEERTKQLAKFFIIQYRDIARAGWCDARLKIHEIITALLDEGWVDPTFPRDMLLDEFWTLTKIEITEDHLLKPLIWHKHCLKLILQHIPIAHFQLQGRRGLFTATSGWQRSRLYSIITRLVRNKEDITRMAILRKLIGRLNRGFYRAASPLFHRAVFKIVGLTPGCSVLDLYPSWGTRALAAAAEGLNYHILPTYMFSPHIGRMLKSIGFELSHDTKQVYDLILVNDPRIVDVDFVVDKVNQWRARAKNIVVFVAANKSNEVAALLNPKQTVTLPLRWKTLMVI